MSELVSSAQLAEMALPILPKSKQGIEHVANPFIMTRPVNAGYYCTFMPIRITRTCCIKW